MKISKAWLAPTFLSLATLTSCNQRNNDASFVFNTVNCTPNGQRLDALFASTFQFAPGEIEISDNALPEDFQTAADFYETDFKPAFQKELDTLVNTNDVRVLEAYNSKDPRHPVNIFVNITAPQIDQAQYSKLKTQLPALENIITKIETMELSTEPHPSCLQPSTI